MPRPRQTALSLAEWLWRWHLLAQWFDGIGRSVATGGYGTFGGAVLERPATAPPRSATVLVTVTRYGGDDLSGAAIGPDGVETRWKNDHAGRRIRLFEGLGGPQEGAAQDAACSGATPRVTEYAYAPDGGLTRLTLLNADTGDQVTRWEYGTTMADSKIARTDLMRAKIYPPGGAGDGSDGTSSRTDYFYNRQSQIIETRDANGTIHAYNFDKIGRQTQDRVTEVGPEIDVVVRRIQTRYDNKRLLRIGVTSYDNAEVGSGTVLNEVAFAYDAFGQLVIDRQEHQGAIDDFTLYVEYGYEDGTRANTSRRIFMFYPDGRRLDYDYGLPTGTDDRLGRVSSLFLDGDGELPGDEVCRYTYAGMARFISAAYPQPGVELTYRKAPGDPVGDAGDPYNGYDRFGRTVDMRWLRGAGSETVTLDRIQYGYDPAGNRTWRRNLAAGQGGQDQAYAYDHLHQVKSAAKGTLNLNQTTIGAIPARDERFDYDPSGNWTRYRVAEDGETQLDQGRVSNRANQLVQIDGSSAGISYDLVGNATSLPPDASGDWQAPLTLVWDAWNRLVEVRDANDETVARYQYDGLFRRTVRIANGEVRHEYYNDQWKIVEERAPEITSSSSSSSSSLSSSSSSSSEETGMVPVAYYPCDEYDSSSYLDDSVGSLNFAPNNYPSTETGFCHGARGLESDRWFEHAHNAVFNPGTSGPLAVSIWFRPNYVYGPQSLFAKTGEYELLLDYNKLTFRIATNTGGGAWDKTVEISHGFSSYAWYHALFWIRPGNKIGLCLNGGTPDTEGLASGQAARVTSGAVLIGLQATYSFSSSYHYSSYYSSSWAAKEEGETEMLVDAQPYQGLVDEIAVFNSALNSTERAVLWNGGYGNFWHAEAGVWASCDWVSSSWHWSSSYYPPSSSWALMSKGESSALSAKSVPSAIPVSSGLLPLASEGDPDRVLTQYVWGARPGHRDELVLRDRASTGSGELDERLYCLMDYFDPTSAVDVDGEVVERYGFSAFGVREVMAPDWSPRAQSWFAWEFGFHGQFLDAETGYYNYGYRYYVPWLGRWVSRDPIGEEGSVNIYILSDNNPNRSIDYIGLISKERCTDAIVDSFQNNAATIEIISEILAEGCSLPIAYCACDCDPGWGGNYQPGRDAILICSNNVSNASKIHTTIQHELVHALQYCRGDSGNECEDSVCREIEANSRANCKQSNPITKRACVINNATLSSSAFDACEGKNVSSLVAQNYDRCS